MVILELTLGDIWFVPMGTSARAAENKHSNQLQTPLGINCYKMCDLIFGKNSVVCSLCHLLWFVDLIAGKKRHR